MSRFGLGQKFAQLGPKFFFQNVRPFQAGLPLVEFFARNRYHVA
jgi:hypothetical protein